MAYGIPFCEGRKPVERRKKCSLAGILSRFTCEGTSERLPRFHSWYKKESRARSIIEL